MYKKFTTFVISAHLIAILILLFMPAKKVAKPHKHIAVRTVQAKTQPATIITNAPAKKTTAASKPAPPPKPKAVKKEAPKPTAAAPKPKPVPKKTTTVVEKNKTTPPKKKQEPQVWKEIDEALAKIDQKVYSSSKSKLDVPQMVAIPSAGFIGEASHEESLVSFLHSSLNLPEFGEVTIQLTVKKDGTVAQLKVMKSESKKNKAYLEQHLPLLKFPLVLENEKTFTLTFCNEI